MRVCAAVILILSTALGQDAKLWPVPADARKVKNRVPMTGEGLRATAPLYQKNCARCHGMTGAANVPQAQSLPSKPARFTDTKMLNRATDGELFWKITTGRDPMPSFAQLSDNERWQLVNYVRDLARRSEYRYLGTKHSR